MSSHSLFEGVNLDQIPAGSYIIEIGCIRQPEQLQTKESSTHYFDQLAKERDYIFHSVDFSRASFELSRTVVGDRAVLSDGVEFLKTVKGRIGILYLDNFDIIYNEKHHQSLIRRVGSSYEENNEVISNQRSAQVHLEQMQHALPKMTQPCYVCIDDTMIRDGEWWGKGATVVPFLLTQGFQIIKQSEDGVLMASPI